MLDPQTIQDHADAQQEDDPSVRPLGRWKRFLEWVEPYARHPLFAVGVTLAIAITGALASIFSTEIRTFQLWLPGRTFSLGATCFWLLFLLTGFLFGLERWASSEARSREQSRLEESSERLLNAIRTMPPRTFLDEFGGIYRRCEQATYSALQASTEPPDLQDVLYAIHAVLLGFAELASAFEVEPTEVPYAANVMLFLSAADLTDEQKDAVDTRLRFCEPETSVRRLQGVLDLRCDLSARTGSTDPEHATDDTLQPFALAVPHAHQHIVQTDQGERSRVLPGGARAWVGRRLEMYTEADDLLGWCEKTGAFGETVMQEIRDYFVGEGLPQVGSFLSSHLALTDDELPIGVVNIHRETPGILKNQKEAADLFINASRPLQLLLTRLLQKLKELEYGQYGTWQHLAPVDDADAAP